MNENGIKAIFGIAVLGIAIAVSWESGADRARKPAIVDRMVDQSLSTCETGPVNASPGQYGTRLRQILSRAYAKDLDALQANNITVCLDQRLPRQQTSFFKRRMEGVYYNNHNRDGVLTLWDDGRQPDQTSFWSKDAYDWGSRLVHNFASYARRGSIRGSDARWFGYEYSYSCGSDDNDTCYDVSWTRDGFWNSTTSGKNPSIVAAPPLKNPRPGADW